MTNSLLPVSAVSLSNGRPMTLSQSVAEVFEKEHFNVLRDIDGLGCSAEFRRLNFEATFRAVPGPNGATRQERCFEMTKDGFTILAMGYTGAKAMQFKEAYIQRFNEMEAQLQASQPTLTDRLRSSRFLLSFDTDDAIRLQEVPARAVLVNPETLADLIGDSGSVFSRSLLPRIIGAAAERLAGLHPAARPHSINSTWPIEPPSIYDQVLMRVTAAKGQGLAVRELISGCWAFRNLTSADRAKLINQMLQDQVLVEIGTTNKTGPRGKRLVAAGKGYQ